MPDTASNIIVQTVGNTANLATDFGTSGVNLSSAHVPLQKMAFGNSGAAIRVSSTDPLPITVSGSDVAITVSGNVGNCGEFGIGNFGTQFLRVAGSTNGADGVTVQGTIGVTAAGPEGLKVTGGIVAGLLATRDTVSVTGSVSLVSVDGTTGAAVRIFSGQTAIGVTGDSLKVSIQDAGFTATISLSSVVGLTNNSSENIVPRIQGFTNGILTGVTGQVEIKSIVQPAGLSAGQFFVGSTPRQMPAAPLGAGVKLRAISTNTATLHIGHTSSLGSTLGYPLLAGESCYLEVGNLNTVFVVGGATGQLISFLGS
jgi:hypothetical protein